MTDSTINISAHPFQTGATVAPGGSLILDYASDLPFQRGERVAAVITPSQATPTPSGAGEIHSKEAMTPKSAFDTMTPHERALEFIEWAERRRRNTPLLYDEAISRESMYPERA